LKSKVQQDKVVFVLKGNFNDLVGREKRRSPAGLPAAQKRRDERCYQPNFESSHKLVYSLKT
jgi:hypothetical protein